MHLLTQHTAVCFLTPRDLGVSWEGGLKVRRSPKTYQHLSGFWGPHAHPTTVSHRYLKTSHWTQCSSMPPPGCGFHRCFHVYSPTTFSKTTDQGMAAQNTKPCEMGGSLMALPPCHKHLSIPKDFPSQAISEAWEAPWGCRSRQDPPAGPTAHPQTRCWEPEEPGQPVPKNAMNSLRDTGLLPTSCQYFGCLSLHQAGDTVGPLVAKSQRKKPKAEWY